MKSENAFSEPEWRLLAVGKIFKIIIRKCALRWDQKAQGMKRNEMEKSLLGFRLCCEYLAPQ